MIKLFNYLLILNIFLGSFALFESPFTFYVGYVFIIFFLIVYIFRYHTISINLNFMLLLTALTIISLIHVYLGSDTLPLMTKQVFGILVTGSAYYLLVKINRYNIDKLFRVYLRIALIVAAIGIFQELSYLVGFERGYNYKYLTASWNYNITPFGMLRVNSILAEAAMFGFAMAPAFFVALSSISRNNYFYLNKKGSILIILSYILTFSTVAYFAILISVLLLFSNVRKFRYLLLAPPVIFILIFISYSNVSHIKTRLDDTIGIAMMTSEAEAVNPSTYALASNAFVAYHSFMDSPLFGHGLGSHPISYEKYILGGTGSFDRDDAAGFGSNKEDADSLFLRLASETGLIGLMVVIYFIFKFNLINSYNKDLKIISNAIFVMFMAHLLRNGHYFVNGLFFFVWLYYFAYITDNDKLCMGSRLELIKQLRV